MDVPERAKVSVPPAETQCDLIVTEAETGETTTHDAVDEDGKEDRDQKEAPTKPPSDDPFIKVSGAGTSGEESKSAKEAMTQAYIAGLTKMHHDVSQKAKETIEKVQQAHRDKVKKERGAGGDERGGVEEESTPVVSGWCNPKPPYIHGVGGSITRIDGEAGMYTHGGESGAEEKGRMMSDKKVSLLKAVRQDRTTDERRARAELDQLMRNQVGVRSTEMGETACERMEAAKAAINTAAWAKTGDAIIRVNEMRTVVEIMDEKGLSTAACSPEEATQRATWGNTLWQHLRKIGPRERPVGESKGDAGGEEKGPEAGDATKVQRVHDQEARRLSLTGTGQTITALYRRGKLIALTIDTGADRNHAGPECTALTDVRRLETPIVAVMANGDRTEITHHGSIRVVLVDARGVTSEHTFDVLVTEGMESDDILISCRELTRVVGQFRAEDAHSGLASVCVQHQGPEHGPQYGVTVGVKRRIPVTIAQNMRRGNRTQPVNDPEATGGSYVLLAHRSESPPDERTVDKMVEEYYGRFAETTDGDGEVDMRRVFQQVFGDRGDDLYDDKLEIMALPNDKITNRTSIKDELEEQLLCVREFLPAVVNPSEMEHAARCIEATTALRRVRRAEADLAWAKESARHCEGCEEDNTDIQWASILRTSEVQQKTLELGDRVAEADQAEEAVREAYKAINDHTITRDPRDLPIMEEGCFHSGDVVTVTCDGGAGEHAGRMGSIVRRTDDLQVSYTVDFGVDPNGDRAIGKVYESELRFHFDPLGETSHVQKTTAITRRPLPTAPRLRSGESVLIRGIECAEGTHLNGQKVVIASVRGGIARVTDQEGGRWKVGLHRIERCTGDVSADGDTRTVPLRKDNSTTGEGTNVRHTAKEAKAEGQGEADAIWKPRSGLYVDVDGEKGVLGTEAADNDGGVGEFMVKVPGQDAFMCPADELVQWKGRRVGGAAPGEQYHVWPPQLHQVVMMRHPSEEGQRIVMLTDIGDGGEVGYDSRVTVVTAMGDHDTVGLDELSPCPGAAANAEAVEMFQGEITKSTAAAAHGDGQGVEDRVEAKTERGEEPRSPFDPQKGDFAVRRGERVLIVAIDRGVVPWGYTVALPDGREVSTELSELVQVVTTEPDETVDDRVGTVERPIFGDRAGPSDEAIMWPPGVRQYVQHCQRTSIVQGRSTNAQGDETVFRVKRVADGVETHDVRMSDLRPCLHDPDDSGMSNRPTSMAPGLRKGSRKTHPRVGGTRWVVNTLLSAYTLHLMFGHAGYDRVKRTLGATFGAQIKGKWPCGGCQDSCEGCRANTKRRKFLKKRVAVRSTQPMVEISMDHPGVLRGAGRGLPTSITGGKVPHVSLCSGSSYAFVHELEDFSGGQVAVVVTDILDFCHSIGVPRVPKWLTDGAMCYVGGPVPKLIAASGGTMEYTNANSSNGNAKVERIIGSLYSMARAMMAHSKMPMCFWFEALAWSAKLHNCMAGTDSTVTPHELVHGRPPVIDNLLHVFGSAMTVTDVTTVRKSPVKLGPTSTKAYFTGVPQKQRGVRGVAPAARGPTGDRVTAILTSRDAFVHELLKPRLETPPELRGLLGPAETEKRGLENLRHTPHHAPPIQAVGAGGGVVDVTPPELYGEPRWNYASALFDGQPVMARDPTGREDRWGHMRGATRNRQDDGRVMLSEEHPARIIYDVMWEDGAGELLTWPEVQPFLVHGLTEPERNTYAEHDQPPDDHSNEWVCSNGHRAYGQTVVSNDEDIIKCDKCGVEIPDGATSITCSRGGCDWDQCMNCASESGMSQRRQVGAGLVERERDATEADAKRRDNPTAQRDRREAIDDGNGDVDNLGTNIDHDPGADDAETYVVGDQVNALYNGKWYNATVIGATADGDLTVQYRDRTQQRVDAARAASDLRLPPGPATVAARAVKMRRRDTDRARAGRTRRDAETVKLANNMESTTLTRATHCTPRTTESIEQRMGRAQGMRTGQNTATRSSTSQEATPNTAPRGGASGASEVGELAEDGESKNPDEKKPRRPPSMSTEKQERAFNGTEHLRFEEGDTITAMAGAEHNREKPGWIILRRGVQGANDEDMEKQKRSHERATGPTWAAWMPEATRGLVGKREHGTAEAISDGSGRGVIWITTNREDKNTTPKERTDSWEAGLAAVERMDGIRDGTFYMAMGVGTGIKGKAWWREYLPAIGRFAIRLGAEKGTTTTIMRQEAVKVEWHEEDRRRNWATRDEQWEDLLMAIDQSQLRGGAYGQGDRRGRPGMETTLRAIESGANLFDVTAGITDPASADGVYEAAEGATVDSNIKGMQSGYYDVDPEIYGAGPDGEGEEGRIRRYHASVVYEAGPLAGKGGGGAVGAPVRFARSTEEHESIRAVRPGSHTAQCLFIDPVPRPGVDENGRHHAETNRARDELARRRELRRLAVAVEKEDDTAAVMTGCVLTDGGARKRGIRRDAARSGEEENGRCSGGGKDPPRAPTIRGTRIRSSWAMVRAWRVCLTSQESVEMLLRPDEAEPTVRDALSGPMRYVWLHACLSEVLTQLHQGTFRVVRRDATLAKDPGCNIMQSGMRLLVKWGYCDPLGEHGPTRFKARFIAGGDTQIRGVDYMYTSSPTPRPASIRWLFGKAADPGWHVYSTDVSGAFCISPAEYDNMYMECPRFIAPDDVGVAYPDGMPARERARRKGTVGADGIPEGYCEEWDPLGAAGRSRSNARRRKPNYSDFILHLLTQCYGTKQASMLWYRLWSKWVKEHGFRRSDGDECLWYRRNEDTGAMLIIATHVDDTLCLTNEPEEYARFVAEMKASFECTDEQEVQYFLGVRVQSDQAANTVVLSQEALSDAIVHEAQAAGCALAETPMIDSQYLVTGGEWDQIDPTIEGGGMDMTKWELQDPEPHISSMERRAVALYPYRRILGMMIHLTTWTRPELAFVVSSLAKYSDPCRCRWTHVKAMARVVAYISGTRTMGLRYVGSASEDPGMVAWVDADHAGNPSTRLSVTGFVIHCRGAAIQWQSGRQKIAAQSSFESELIASRAVTAEMMALAKDYAAIEQKPLPTPFRIGCDNMAVCAVSEGAGKYSKRKFIAIRYFLIRRAVRQGLMVLCSVPTDWNVADLFTKSLGWDKFRRFRDKTMNVERRVVEDGENWLAAV